VGKKKKRKGNLLIMSMSLKKINKYVSVFQHTATCSSSMVEVKIKESDERYMIIILWKKNEEKKRKLTKKIKIMK